MNGVLCRELGQDKQLMADLGPHQECTCCTDGCWPLLCACGNVFDNLAGSWARMSSSWQPA
jgi:hypothetical protein